jgi:hypothetical protein
VTAGIEEGVKVETVNVTAGSEEHVYMRTVWVELEEVTVTLPEEGYRAMETI